MRPRFDAGHLLDGQELTDLAHLVISSYPNAAARDADMQSQTAGQLALLTDSGTLTCYTGTAWVTLSTTTTRRRRRTRTANQIPPRDPLATDPNAYTGFWKLPQIHTAMEKGHWEGAGFPISSTPEWDYYWQDNTGNHNFLFESGIHNVTFTSVVDTQIILVGGGGGGGVITHDTQVIPSTSNDDFIQASVPDSRIVKLMRFVLEQTWSRVAGGGGAGGLIHTTRTMTPGDMLRLVVGAGGQPGNNGEPTSVVEDGVVLGSVIGGGYGAPVTNQLTGTSAGTGGACGGGGAQMDAWMMGFWETLAADTVGGSGRRTRHSVSGSSSVGVTGQGSGGTAATWTNESSGNPVVTMRGGTGGFLGTSGNPGQTFNGIGNARLTGNVGIGGAGGILTCNLSRARYLMTPSGHTQYNPANAIYPGGYWDRLGNSFFNSDVILTGGAGSGYGGGGGGGVSSRVINPSTSSASVGGFFGPVVWFQDGNPIVGYSPNPTFGLRPAESTAGQTGMVLIRTSSSTALAPTNIQVGQAF